MERNVRRLLVLALVRRATKAILAKKSATRAHTVKTVRNAVIALMEPHAMLRLANVYAQ